MDKPRTTLHVKTLATNEVFHLKKVSTATTVATLKARLNPLLGDSGAVTSDALVLLREGGSVNITDTDTIAGAGLEGATLLVMTSEQYHGSPHKVPPALPPSALKKSVTIHETPTQRSTVRSTGADGTFALRVQCTLGSSGDAVLKGVSARSSVGWLLDILARHVAHPQAALLLLHDGQPLAEGDSIGSAGVTPDSKLTLIAKDPTHILDNEKISVYLETAAGDVTSLRVPLGSRVQELSNAAAANWDMPQGAVVLSVGGATLDPRATLSAAGVQDEQTLLVTSSLPATSLRPKTCHVCGLPQTTTYCTVSGERHLEAAEAHPLPGEVTGPLLTNSIQPIEEVTAPSATEAMHITISVFNKVDGKEYRLPTLRPGAVTVRKVKLLLAKAVGVPVADMVLKGGGGAVALLDTLTLRQAGIVHGESLVLSVRGLNDFVASGELHGGREPTTLGIERTYPTMSPPKQFPTAFHPDEHPLVQPHFDMDDTYHRDGSLYHDLQRQRREHALSHPHHHHHHHHHHPTERDVRTRLHYDTSMQGYRKEDMPPAYDMLPHSRPAPPRDMQRRGVEAELAAHPHLTQYNNYDANTQVLSRVDTLQDALEEVKDQLHSLKDRQDGLVESLDNADRKQAEQDNRIAEENDRRAVKEREAEREARWLREDLEEEKAKVARLKGRTEVAPPPPPPPPPPQPPSPPGEVSRNNAAEVRGATTFDSSGRITSHHNSRTALPHAHPALRLTPILPGGYAHTSPPPPISPLQASHGVAIRHIGLPSVRNPSYNERAQMDEIAYGQTPVWEKTQETRREPGGDVRGEVRDKERVGSVREANAARDEAEEGRQIAREREWRRQREQEAVRDAEIDRAFEGIAAEGGGSGGEMLLRAKENSPYRLRHKSPKTATVGSVNAERSALELHEASIDMQGLSEAERKTELRMEAARKAELQKRASHKARRGASTHTVSSIAPFVPRA